MQTSLLSELACSSPDMLPGRMVNVAAHASIAVKYLNVPWLATLADIGMQYNKAQFGAGKVHIAVRGYTARGGGYAAQVVTVLVFESGKLIFTGGENEYVTRMAAHQFAIMLGSALLGAIAMRHFCINNIVFNYFLEFEVNLLDFSIAEGTGLCKYIPDDFPAAIYQFTETFAALVNYTGRIIITGSKDRNVSAAAYEVLYKKLLDFKKGAPPKAPALTYAGQPSEGGGVVGCIPSDSMMRTCALMDGNERAESFLQMNHHWSMLMNVFYNEDLEQGLSPDARIGVRESMLAQVDHVAPEMGIGKFMENHARMKALCMEDNAGPQQQ